MIPVRLALTASTTSAATLKDFMEVPEGGSATAYLTFRDSSTATVFEMRRRIRKRHKTSDIFDEWGAWTTWKETLAARSGGARISQTPVSMSASDINPAGFDLAEVELQVREDPDGEWSQSLFARVRFSPAVTLSCVLSGTSTLQLTLASSWLRNDNTIVIEDVLIGQTTGISALPSILVTPKKAIELGRIIANGSADFSVYNFKRYPISNEVLTFVYRFATCDGEVGGLRYTPVQMPYNAANTPVLTVVPYPDEGCVQITVADSGDKGKPLTAASVLMLNGRGRMDLLPLAIGKPSRHRVPPLDTQVTYQAIALAADGSRATLNKTTMVESLGRLWLNWGEELEYSLALDANASWQSSSSRHKVYFEPAEGLPKVFYGKGHTRTRRLRGEVLYPRSRDELESLAGTTRAVIREPYGARSAVAIDSVDVEDDAALIQTVVDIDATEVQER